MCSFNPSLAKKILKKSVYSQKLDIDTIRQNYEDAFYEKNPKNIDIQTVYFKNIDMDILKPIVSVSDRCIIYIHGGWFISGSKKAYKGFCASLAHSAKTLLVLPEYRLAPEYLFPCALEDIYTTYIYVCEQYHIDANKIILCGDGAGANIAVSLIHYLKEKSLPIPGGLALISPWLDLQNIPQRLKKAQKKDLFMNVDILNSVAKLYVGSAKMENKLISPLLGNFEDFPPTFIQISTKEILLEDAMNLQAKILEQKSSVQLDLWKDLWYFFQAMPNQAPQAHLAVEKMGKAIIQIYEKTFE